MLHKAPQPTFFKELKTNMFFFSNNVDLLMQDQLINLPSHLLWLLSSIMDTNLSFHL